MDEAGWTEVAHSDRHHGKIFTTDGGTFWVMPRLHLRGGWFVETRVGSPSGSLIQRRWVATSWDAGTLVTERRAEISRLDVDAVIAQPFAIEEPRRDLGVIAAHGHKGRRGAPPQQVIIDGGPQRSTCCVVWVEAGRHDLRWGPSERRSVGVDAGTVVHAHRRWFAALWTPPEDRMLPPLHRCRVRSLRFEDGWLRADRDVREVAKGW